MKYKKNDLGELVYGESHIMCNLFSLKALNTIAKKKLPYHIAYKKADYIDHPRMVALDEAFAGVDDKNISSMFELVHKMDFDYIMNSQSLWGCYETVKGIKIAELHRPMNSQVVTVIRYVWNGHERILDVQ